MATTSTDPRRITVLISGSGTNLQALMDAITRGMVPNAQIVRVISNRIAAFGLTRARNASIPTTYHNLVPFKKRFPEKEGNQARLAYDAELANIVLADRPDLVVCLGFMHILTSQFLDPVARAKIGVINLHPALPKQFDGIDAIERAHKAWMEGQIEHTGVMLHEVIAEVDQGRPIICKNVAFVKGQDEDVEKFKAKVHKVEWDIVPRGVVMALQESGRQRMGPS